MLRKAYNLKKVRALLKLFSLDFQATSGISAYINVFEKILRHCGLWVDIAERALSEKTVVILFESVHPN